MLVLHDLPFLPLVTFLVDSRQVVVFVYSGMDDAD
jgi:hypothetical protein